jgi:hypothetical protein
MEVRRYRRSITALAIAALVWPASRIVRGGAQAALCLLGHSASEAAAHSRLADAFGKLPLSFEANRGQADPRVRFLVRGSSYGLFLTRDSAVLVLHGSNSNQTDDTSDGIGESQESGRLKRRANGHFPPSIGRTAARDDRAQGKDSLLYMTVEGMDPRVRVEGLDELSGRSNYFIGSDPKQWHTSVPNYAKVKYTNVYPGVDLVYHGNQGRLEYEFVVQPSADPRQIRLAVQSPAPGSSNTSESTIDRNGDLLVKTGGGELRFDKPVVYQPTNSSEAPTRDERGSTTGGRFVSGNYVLQGNRVTFKIAAYDKSEPLIIDPTLVYSTFLGGVNWDHGYGIAIDSSGDAYVIGNTYGGNFPVTPGAFGTIYKNPSFSDVFVTELNAAGSGLVYSTYLAGSNDQEGDGIAVDTSGNAYVTGWTLSTNFPTTAGALRTTMGGGGDDGFVSKLNATGSALLYSTYLGGSSYDEGHGIAVDSSGDAYVAGLTYSKNFPTTAGTLQTTLAGLDDAFVSELNPAGSALLYSTFLGGSSYDDARGIAIDASGDAYVTGLTYSTNFPTSLRALLTTARGGYDAFVSKLNPGGSVLIYSTYLGGDFDDMGYGIAVDSSGCAYVTGLTFSLNFPTTTDALQKAKGGGAHNPYDDAFMSKLNPTGSALRYSTYLGGSGDDVGYGIAVDGSGDAFVTGATYSSDFPTTPGAPQTTPGGYDDGFVSEVNPLGSALVYSTYMAGNSWDEGRGIIVDSFGNAYVTGWTLSGNFPVTTGAFQTIIGGSHDAWIAKIGAQ